MAPVFLALSWERINWSRYIDYEQSLIFLKDSRVGEPAARSRALPSTIPEIAEKNEGLLVI